MVKLFHSRASLADAVKPGVTAIVARELDGYLDETIKRAQEEVAARIRAEFASTIEISVNSSLNYDSNKDSIEIVIDLRNNGQALKGGLS